MQLDSLNFVIWWFVTVAVLGVATWTAAGSRRRVSFEELRLVFLVGIAAGLTMYLAPSGTSSVQSLQDVLLRFFAALGFTWLVAIRSLPAGSGPAGYSTLALAGFAGVNAPLLAFAVSSFVVCGAGQPSCAL